MGSLGRKYAFNIFFVAFMGDECGIYPLQKMHLRGIYAAKKMLKNRFFAPWRGLKRVIFDVDKT